MSFFMGWMIEEFDLSAPHRGLHGNPTQAHIGLFIFLHGLFPASTIRQLAGHEAFREFSGEVFMKCHKTRSTDKWGDSAIRAPDVSASLISMVSKENL